MAADSDKAPGQAQTRPPGRTRLGVPGRAATLASALCAGLLVVVFLPVADWGLPVTSHVDELLFGQISVQMVADGTANPRWFGNPTSVQLYFGAGWLLLSSLWVGDPVAEYYQDPSLVLIPMRVMNLLCVGLAAVLAQRLARRVVGPVASLAAPLAILGSPLIWTYGLTARSDANSLISMVILLYCATFVLRGAVSGYRIAGIGIGVATVAKYPLVLGAVLVPLFHILTQRRRGLPWTTGWTGVMSAAIVSMVTAFVLAPYLFLDLWTVLRDLSVEARAAPIETDLSFVQSIALYLSVLAEECGWILGPLAGLGLILAVVRVHGVVLALAALCVLLIVFLAALPLEWPRWMIPVLPVPGVLAAYALHCGETLLPHRPEPRIATAILLLAALGLALPQLWAVRQSHAAPTAAEQAARWIEANLPPGTGLLVDNEGPRLDQTRYRVFAAAGNTLRPVDLPHRHVLVLQSWRDPGLLDAIANSDVEYLVHTADAWDTDPAMPSRSQVYTAIMGRYPLVYRSAPAADRAVSIYRVTD